MSMIIEVEIERHFPPNFFVSANEHNDNTSVSEDLGKALLVVATGIDENNIVRGNPNNYEPDFVINDNAGFEITFASNRELKKEKGNIARLKKGKYKIQDMENDLIKSIEDSISEKATKKKAGNYQTIEKVSVLVISLEPLLYWYGYLHDFDHPKTLKRRDAFFSTLYDEYIASSILENIYIAQLTEFTTIIFFDLKAFHNNSDECLTEIGAEKENLYKLPRCFKIGEKIISDSISNDSPKIIYKFGDIFWEIDKS